MTVRRIEPGDVAAVSGAGTIGLEIIDDVPGPLTTVVCVGGGGLLAGLTATLRPGDRIVGVEPLGAGGAEHRLVDAEAGVDQRQPLDQVARLIAGASFVVGVDTGLLHLAAALGVPLVAIFLGSEPKLTGPMGQGPIEVLGAKGAPPSVVEVADTVKRLVALK